MLQATQFQSKSNSSTSSEGDRNTSRINISRMITIDDESQKSTNRTPIVVVVPKKDGKVRISHWHSYQGHYQVPKRNMHRSKKRRWPRCRHAKDWQTIWSAKRFTLKWTINLLCRFWAQRILMKCCQESSDCECVSCDPMSLFLMSLVRNSQLLMRCHVHPQSLRRKSSKRSRSSST